ncbi:MAG: BatA domain-containing protein, partial [Verrucomicrobiota bacterium]|nr:BatA domain-containing protein [Verrucomicrobiota bacterium]
MNFLNLGLALGAAAFLIPLLIHIFNRSRFRVVQWGAMHLLESVLRVNRKQVQLEQIILLIIRCAIPILLALCLARMVVTDWSAFIHRILLPLSALGFLIMVALFPKFGKIFGLLCAVCLLYGLAGEFGLVGGGYAGKNVTSESMEIPSSSVVLLDDSFSMNANGGFAKASAFTEGFLKKLRKGSEASVVRMGGSPSPLFPKPTSETETLGERSGQLLASYDRLDLAGALESGLATVSKGINAKRELIVLSDFRKSDWADTGSSFLNLKKRMKAEPLKPVLTFIDVGGPAEENLSVEKIELSAHSIGIGQKVLIRAELRNHGAARYEGDLVVR